MCLCRTSEMFLWYAHSALNVDRGSTDHLLGAQPAGACTCDQAAVENQKVVGESCPCGLRPKGEQDNSGVEKQD